MTWDLFTSAAEAAKQPPLNEARNEDAARRVAARQADEGFPDLLDPIAPAAPARTAKTAGAKTAGAKSAKGAKSGRRGRSAKSALLAALGRPGVEVGFGMEDELGGPLDLDPDAGLSSAGRAPEGGWTPSTLNAAARHLIEGMFPP
ncbi:MAG TPA: hypothetical protein VFR37_21005, partial [Longimicrobium sp.]|nr:hypothetical protein [Longimicrobium sp.]